nr:16S rRNA processing protein RimM [Prevotella sp.]
MIKKEDVFQIGKLGRPHGIKGEVSFNFDDDVFDRVDADYLILEIDGILVPFFIDEYRFKGSETALMKFADIDTQDRARELTGCKVFFPRKLSDSEDEEMSWAEIIGFSVVDADTKKMIGKIKSVDDSTVNTLFEISVDDGDDILLPAHENLVKEVNVERHEIVMQLPDGLLDL